MRMLEIPFLILGEQMLLFRSNSGENPLMFIAPTVEFLKQVRDSPELDMVAGVDDSFNSQTATHSLQIFFFVSDYIACITSVFTVKMSHIVEPVGNPVFHFTSLQLLAVEFKRNKKQKTM